MIYMENKFYVYEWFNTDTNEVFYVGKGCGNRYKNTKYRNKLFQNYINNNNVDKRIVFDNMSEQDAFQKENELILYYKNINQCTCNISEGGHGGCNFVWNDEMKKYKSEYNPMKDNIQKERMSKNNPMHDKETAKNVGIKHRKTISINGIIYCGINYAAEQLHVSPVTICKWCQKGENPKGQKCFYIDQPVKPSNNQKNYIPVIIDGQYFRSIQAGAYHLKVAPKTLSNALKNNRKINNHLCEYANQQPSQGNSDNSTLEGSTTNG